MTVRETASPISPANTAATVIATDVQLRDDLATAPPDRFELVRAVKCSGDGVIGSQRSADMADMT